MKLFIPVEPMGAVRMTQRGKFVKPSAQRYLNYKKAVGWHIKQHWRREPTDAPVSVTVKFVMPIPPSWPKVKQHSHVGMPHKNRPDIDNLIKGFLDSANGIIWTDDKRITGINSSKVYGKKPGIAVEVEELF